MRPGEKDAAPFYQKYIALAHGEDPLVVLKQQNFETIHGISEDKAGYRYEPGKWTVANLVQHLIDVERVFAFRALHFSRGDQQALAGFDENAWADATAGHQRPLQSLAEELDTVRKSTIQLFESFTEAQIQMGGSASGHYVSVNALAFITVGHVAHHFQILQARYLH